ncbi:MAG TPA: choice-of-anchor D domain-containing protein, partial [Candidatus Kapabacteria bacterium]|nr:choice-of-anchor D domain-containing protein [Candidatus Kapabacteria bacterium]
MKNLSSSFRVLALAISILFVCSGISHAIRVDKMVYKPLTDKFTEIYGQGGSLFNYGSISYQAYYTSNETNCYINLPFAFNFDDVNYNAGSTLYAHVGSINFAYWSTVGNAGYYYPIIQPSLVGYQASYFPSAIAVFSGLQAGNSSYTSGIYYMTTGSAPNRVLTIEWYAMTNYYAGELGNCSYEIKLYETSNIIDLLYEKNSFSMTNSSYNSYYKTIGLNGSLSPSFVQLSITNSTTSTPSTNYRIGPPGPNIQLSSSPKIVNFGSQVTGASTNATVTVTNVGTAIYGPPLLNIKSVTLTGTPDFTIVSIPSPTDDIAMNDSRQIVVKFTPIIDGIRTATLTIGSNGIDSAVQTIALQGIGLAPLISVDTNVLFKNKPTKLGQSLVARVIINSTNLPTLTINNFQFVGDDASEFSIAQLPSSMQIPGNKSDSIFIRYSPTKEGRHIATLLINNNSINNPSLPITLYGTGILPHIIVTPTVMLFDSIPMGTEVCKNIRLYNPGTDTLLIKSNTVVSNDGDYTYTGISGADSIIPPDKFKEVTVCFKPKAKGSRVARLRFTTNIPKTFEQPSRDTAGQFLIDIRGTGVPFGQISQKIGNIEGGGWTDESIIGKEICINDTIWNNGGADINVTSMVLSGGSAANYTITGKVTPFIIKANGYAVVRICCTPTTQGPNPATLTINGTSSEKAISSVSTLSIKGLMVCASATPNPLFDGHIVLENTDSAICVDVTNCGDVPTSYTASLPGGTDYTINGTNPSGVIAPGAKATFCIHFNPKTMGDA